MKFCVAAILVALLPAGHFLFAGVLPCDVAVVGGGSAGVAAAWSAAARGARTVLVERNSVLGGTSTAGGVSSWEPVCGARGLPEMLYGRLHAKGKAGVYRFARHIAWDKNVPSPFPGALLEIDDGVPYSATLRRHGPGMKDEAWFRANCRGVIFEPGAMAHEMRSILEETGRCRVLTDVSFVSLKRSNGRVVQLALSNGDVLEPKVVIDACGAVAKAAGCELMRSARPNGATLMYRVRPGGTAEAVPAPKCWWAKDYPLAFCMKLPSGEIAVNMLPTIDGEEVRRLAPGQSSLDECRRRVRAHWAWMRTKWPEFASWEISWIAPELAQRDTFRVRGDAVLTGADVRAGVRPSDEIASADHALDAHGGEGFGGELAQPYGIPYRCLIAAGVENLLLAGRIASFDTVAASSCRLSRTMMKLGEAAGAAAAHAVQEGVSIRSVHASDIRDIYVSPLGDDSAPGTRRSPVATPARALELAAGRFGAVVHFAGGFYSLSAPLRLKSEHAGITLAALPGAVPVLSGGRRISGWTRRPDGWWSANVDPAWRFSQLYVNDRRRLRPYLPRTGYYWVAEKVPVPPGVRPTKFYCREGDVRCDMRDFGRIEFCSFQNWVMSRVPLADFDPATRLVTLAGGVHRPGQCELTDEHWYRLDNVRDALGEVPGEWYLENDGALLYVPEKGEDLPSAVVVAPELGRLVEVEGADGVTFSGLTFAHARWDVPEKGHPACQAESRISPWAVSVVDSSRVVFERCVFRHMGASALEFGRRARACRAVSCEFYDLGGGGVHVGPGWDGSNPGDNSTDFARMPAANYAWDCEVTNCFVACGGRVQPAAVGIWVTHAPQTRIFGNTVTDFYYSGMSVGWNWALGTNSTWANEIAYNRVARIGRGVLSDLGGIYMLGAQRGTVLHGNYIHDVTRSRYGAWGVYFDSGSSFITVSNNLVRSCSDGGWYLARLSAQNNVVGNIFENSVAYQICPMPRRSESSASLFASNILKWARGPLMPQDPGPASVRFFGNVAFAPPCADIPAGFSRMQSDPSGYAERCRALERGAGCSFRPSVLSLPRPPDVYPPAPPRRQVFVEHGDFESLPAGSSWPGWTVYSPSPSLVRVSDERAASGTHSLCVTDDGKPGYRPFLESLAYRAGGPLRIAFDLYLERGARPRFETRDNDAYVLAAGPVVSVDAQGRFCAGGGRVLCDAVYGKWLHIELSCLLGGESTPVYSLEIAVPGEPAPRRWADLRMHPRFTSLGWTGIISHAAGAERFFVDNFTISDPETPAEEKGRRK